jgi:uncharacterized YigZ family protein
MQRGILGFLRTKTRIGTTMISYWPVAQEVSFMRWQSNNHIPTRISSNRPLSSLKLSPLPSTNMKTIEAGLHVTTQVHEVKKSKFIGYVSPAATYDDALAVLNEIKTKLHPKARHWCHGYIALNSMNQIEQRSCDDGEPTGTAGQPILSAIQMAQVVNVVCVIVRYYGGIQLGTGGLIRSYGKAAQDILRQAPTAHFAPQNEIHIQLHSIQYVSAVYDLVNSKMTDCSVVKDTYDVDGNVFLTIIVNESETTRLMEQLNDVTRGNISFLAANLDVE